jgi:molecular chaperone GrpE
MSADDNNPDPPRANDGDPADDVVARAEAILAEAEAAAQAETPNATQSDTGGAETVDPSTVDVSQVLAERDEYLNSLRRLQADFDNYRKRVGFDQEMAADKASQKLIDAMLPVLDTFEMALSHEADPNASPLAKMHDQLLSALEGQGLERLAPLGEPFNPEEAEAVMHEAGDGSADGPVVSEMLRAGYRWRGRVIRAAMVKVKD